MGCPLLRNAFAGVLLVLLSQGKFSRAALQPRALLLLLRHDACTFAFHFVEAGRGGEY